MEASMATPSEVSGLSIMLANADDQINKALDEGDRRAFRVWCQRRASLLARVEKALLSVATAKAPA